MKLTKKEKQLLYQEVIEIIEKLEDSIVFLKHDMNEAYEDEKEDYRIRIEDNEEELEMLQHILLKLKPE